MTIEEFGQTIKAKYPQYKNKTNKEVGEAMLKKYPQYQSRITGKMRERRAVPTVQYERPIGPEPAPVSARERLRDVSAGDVTGQVARGYGQALIGGAKGLGSTLSGLASLGQRGLERTVGAGLRRFGIGEEPPARTAGEIAKERFFTPEGAVQKGAFAGEQLAEWVVPGAKVAKLERGMRLPGRMVTEAGVFGGISGAQEGRIGREAATSALIGGAFPVGQIGVKAIVKGIPKTAWSNILKRTPTEAAKKPELARMAAETGIAGISRKSISRKLQKRIEGVELKLDDLLSDKVGKVETKNVVKYLNDLKKSYTSIPGEGSSIKVINKIAKEVSKEKELTVKQANTIKRNIYKMIAKSYGKGMLELPAKTESQKMIARGLKKEIEKIIPEVKTLNERQAIYIQMKKAIEKTIARREGKGVFGTGIGLYDLMIGGIATGAYGGTTGLAAIGGAKLAGSAAVSSGVAKMMNYFNSLSPTQKMIFYNAMKGLTTKGKEEYYRLRSVSNPKGNQE